MYYIKRLLILTAFLGGCASDPASVTPDRDASTAGNETKTAQAPGSSAQEIALYRRAITELNNNELDKAEISFLEMVKLQPDLAGPWANLALLYIMQKKYDKAEKHIQEALNRNTKMAQALNMAGYLAEKKNQINKARNFYEQAISSKPDYAIAHYNLALVHDVYLQNLAKAVEHYERYLSLIKHEDIKTREWVQELKRNLDKVKQ